MDGMCLSDDGSVEECIGSCGCRMEEEEEDNREPCCCRGSERLEAEPGAVCQTPRVGGIHLST